LPGAGARQRPLLSFIFAVSNTKTPPLILRPTQAHLDFGGLFAYTKHKDEAADLDLAFDGCVVAWLALWLLSWACLTKKVQLP
jgi:hypothetical protein